MSQRPAARGVLLCALLVLATALVTGCGGSEPSADVDDPSSKADVWSTDQQAVVVDFGPPQTFTIVWGEDPANDDSASGFPIHRVEFWHYHDAGIQVEFSDGELVAEGAFEPFPGEDLAFVKPLPYDFEHGMTLDEVIDLLGAGAGGPATIDGPAFEGLEGYSWGFVTAMFEDGGLVAVETYPMPSGGGS